MRLCGGRTARLGKSDGLRCAAVSGAALGGGLFHLGGVAAGESGFARGGIYVLTADFRRDSLAASGGQKQRLSIARAVAKDPEIYIFDDSFSALDYKTDVKLRAALQAETHGSTTLIVAQRISTILHADQIIVLDEGNIVGKGTHEELLKTCPVYQQIAKSQLSEDDLKKAREVSDHE